MLESATTWSWLLLTAFIAGIINSVAGGGTLLTFPTLLFALHSSVGANATSTVALVPGSLGSVWAYRRELHESRRWLAWLVWPSLAGGAAGSLLVTQLPESYFDAVVPWLILAATLLFLTQPLVNRLAGTSANRPFPAPRVLAAALGCQFLVALYGGYFGAGIGIMMLAGLSFMKTRRHPSHERHQDLPGDVHQQHGRRCLRDQWQSQLALRLGDGSGSHMGGYFGARVARRQNRELVRWVVIVIGFTLAAWFFYRQWTY